MAFMTRTKKRLYVLYDLKDDVSYLALNSQHLWQTDDQVISTFDPNKLDHYNSLYSDPDYLKRMIFRSSKQMKRLNLFVVCLTRPAKMRIRFLFFTK